MTSNSWQTVRLGEHCSKIGSGATPRGGESVYQDTGIAFIRSQNVYNGYFAMEGLAHLGEDHADQLKGVTVEPGDVLLNITGDSVARSCRVPSNVLPARVNQHVAIIRPKPEDFDSRFVSYFLTSPLMQQTMLSLAGSGGTRKALTKEMIEHFQVPCPPRSTQVRIADILSTYDDLIENNRRQMALLEEAARQLYREWFVRLRFPGHEHTRIVNGVPAGWESGTVSDFFDTKSGGTPSRTNPDFYSGDINWVKTQELNDDFIFETEERITEDAIAKSSAKLFPADTLLVSIYGGSNIGRTGILAKPAATNQACCALLPRDTRAHYIYGALYFRDKRDQLIALSQGAAQTNISQQVIRALRMQMATPSIMTAFVESLSPAFEQMKTLKRYTEKLRAARDLLLPRLMSGEIAV